MTSTISSALHEVRELVTDYPVRAYLEQTKRYIEICDAMDAVRDKTGMEQREGVNVLAGWQGLPELKDDDNLLTVLTDVRNRLLNERKNGLYKKFVKTPVAEVFGPGTGYALEKIAGATGPGISDPMFAEAAVEELRVSISAFRSALKERGLAGDDMTDDALYIIERVSQFLSNSDDQPAERDLSIMTRMLRILVKEMEKESASIDSDDKKNAE